MSLIPKKKPIPQQLSTVSRLELSWRKEDAHTKPQGELRVSSAPQTEHCTLGCSQSLPQLCAHLLFKGSSHSLGQAQGTHKCHSPACTTHVLSQ